MPRYHFHAYGPNRHLPDREGAYLDDMIVVRDLAFAAARTIVGDPNEGGDYRRWRIEVADQDGRVALIVPFRSALAAPVRSRRTSGRTAAFGRPRLLVSRAGAVRHPAAE